MKVTINRVTYEGTEDEIRRIVENPPGQIPHVTYGAEEGEMKGVKDDK